MSRRFILTLALVLSVLIMGIVPTATAAPASQADANVRLRLVDGMPDSPPVDIFIDGELAASQLTYAQYTDYLQTTEGDHAVSVQANGVALAEATVSATPGEAITIIVAGTADAPEVLSFGDDLSPLALGNVRVNAIHAASGTDTVDIVLSDGTPVLQGLTYGQSSGGIDIPANVYPLAVTPAGSTVDQALRPAEDFYLGAGMLYRLVILGGTSPGTLLLESPVNPAGDSVWVRVAHAIAEAPAVDVYADETLLIPNLESGQITPHFALPLGTYNLTVRGAGSDSTVAPIASATLDISDPALAGQGRTVVAMNAGNALMLQVYEDDFSDLAPTSARLSVLNVLADAALTATLSDGTTISAPPLAEGAVPAAEVAAGTYTLTVDSEVGSAALEGLALNGGALYSVIVTGTSDAPELILGQRALTTRPGSVVAAAAAAPAAPVVEATEEAPAPTQAPAPTEAPPTEAAPPVVSAPQSAPTEGLIGLIYNLNPGANLHLREYPRADARSLGLIQGGTVVQVLGRAGEPDYPALADLSPNEDLDPTETWLSIVMTTPDGGTITAWVLAQYVQVTENGERVRLADLDPLPSDVPGEVAGAAAGVPTPAPVEAEFYATIFNLNEGVNLHIRRTPEITGESLIRLPAGTILEPIGVLQDYSWTFVRYTPEDGGFITGWAATQYLQFVFRGSVYLPTEQRIDEFILRNLLVIMDPTERGEVAPGTNVEVPTPEQAEFLNQIVATTTLDPGANLHLRRTPDAASESLALIPSGATMVVFGRTSDAEWLQVNYDNTEGWVASAYVELRLNGRRVDILDVPEVQP